MHYKGKDLDGRRKKKVGGDLFKCVRPLKDLYTYNVVYIYSPPLRVYRDRRDQW